MLPCPAASIITPMIDFALTRRPFLEIQTSEEKRLATWVTCAEGRACRPSLLLMVKSLVIIALRLVTLVLHRRRGNRHHALLTSCERLVGEVSR